MAGLVPQQPRPFAYRHALRARARPGRGDARAHPARHAVPLSGRGARTEDVQVPADRVVDVDGRDPVRAPMPWVHLRPQAPAPGSRRRRRGSRSHPDAERVAASVASPRSRFHALAAPRPDRIPPRRPRPSRGRLPPARRRHRRLRLRPRGTTAPRSPSTSRRSRGRGRREAVAARCCSPRGRRRQLERRSTWPRSSSRRTRAVIVALRLGRQAPTPAPNAQPPVAAYGSSFSFTGATIQRIGLVRVEVDQRLGVVGTIDSRVTPLPSPPSSCTAHDRRPLPVAAVGQHRLLRRRLGARACRSRSRGTPGACE